MQQKEDKASREEEAKRKISCSKKQNPNQICTRKNRKASREEAQVENPAATKTKPKINDIHEKDNASRERSQDDPKSDYQWKNSAGEGEGEKEDCNFQKHSNQDTPLHTKALLWIRVRNL